MIILSTWCYAKEVIIGGGSLGWSNWSASNNTWQETKRERYGNPYPEVLHMESSEEGTGSFRSPDFQLTGTHIKFIAGGWAGLAKNPSSFRLVKASDKSVLRSVSPGNIGNDLVTYTWFVPDLKDEIVYFEAVDNYSNWGYAWLQLAYVSQISRGNIDKSHKFRVIETRDPRSFGTWRIVDVDSMGNATRPFLSSGGYGESGTGLIVSPAFAVTSDIKIVLRGWDGKNGDAQQNLAEIIDDNTNEVLVSVKPPIDNGSKETVLDMSKHIGKTVRCQFKDINASNSYAWFGVDSIDAGSYKIDFSTNPSLDGWMNNSPKSELVEQFGIPFLANERAAVKAGGTFTVPVEFNTNRLYLLGMNHSDNAWNWLGDYMGDIEIVYTDGSKDTYPVLFGESIWWGKKFYTYPEPFTSDKKANKLLKETLRLYPQAPVENGLYISVIDTDKEKTIKSVNISDNPDIGGNLCVYGISAETNLDDELGIFGMDIPKNFWDFADKFSLRSSGVGEGWVSKNINEMANLMYATEQSFPKDFKIAKPKNYKGVSIEFDGDPLARLMTNVFYSNVIDMAKKVTDDGEFHTSTFGAPWYGYEGVGLYTDNLEKKTRMYAGFYYDEAWTRDLGRVLSELNFLGYEKKALDCADWVFKMARGWETNPDVKLNGVQLPRHIQRIMQWYQLGEGAGCFENDGHGLTAEYIYNTWKRMSDKKRTVWLKDNWADIKGLGDWAVWQLENPSLSKATDSLWSDSEGSGWNITTGYSIYCDLAQIEALYGLSEMALSVNEKETADKWLKTAKGLKVAAEKNYLIDDPKYGKTWTLKYCGFGGSSTLGPIILPTDRTGLNLKYNYPEWYEYNKRSYKRNLDGFKPHAFGYGQGFITQSALLFDDMNTLYDLLYKTGRTLYNPSRDPYLIPENVIYKPDMSVTARAGDLGNGVQQAEILKTLRLMAGLDDTNQKNIKIMPRLPLQWNSLEVSDLPIVFELSGKRCISTIKYSFKKDKNRADFSLDSKDKLPDIMLRLGAFDSNIKSVFVKIDGKSSFGIIERSGDSAWVHIKLNSGAKKIVLSFK